MPNIRRSNAKLLKTETKALDNGVVQVTVATDDMDRHGEIIDIKGINTKDYSGVVLWGHDQFAIPIGKSLSLTKTNDGKLISKTQLAVEEYDFANTVYKLIQGGYITDASIGFIPKAFDAETNTWTQSDMVEFSFVTIGANAAAKVSSKALEEIGLTEKSFDDQIKTYMKQTGVQAVKTDEVPKVVKGPVADELNEQEKWEYTEDFWEVVYAFCDAYYSPDIKAAQFNELLTECISILQTIVDGTYAFEDEPDDSDSDVMMSLKKKLSPERIRELLAKAKKLDVTKTTGDNVQEHLDVMKKLISATETELKSLPQDSEASEQTNITKRIVLVRAKKTLNTVDRVAELAIGELKKGIKEEQTS